MQSWGGGGRSREAEITMASLNWHWLKLILVIETEENLISWTFAFFTQGGELGIEFIRNDRKQSNWRQREHEMSGKEGGRGQWDSLRCCRRTSAGIEQWGSSDNYFRGERPGRGVVALTNMEKYKRQSRRARESVSPLWMCRIGRVQVGQACSTCRAG